MSESKTGFVKDGGTKNCNCHICRFMKGSVCTEPTMIRFSNQPRDNHNAPYVDKNDVCDYFRMKSLVAHFLKENR